MTGRRNQFRASLSVNLQRREEGEAAEKQLEEDEQEEEEKNPAETGNTW